MLGISDGEILGILEGISVGNTEGLSEGDAVVVGRDEVVGLLEGAGD